MSDGGCPAGYVRVTAGRCEVVTRADLAADARALLAEGTPYEAAARDLGARTFEGRGLAYAIALPVSGTRVVVRHNRHGGLFAPLTRDLFLPPSRAAYELEVALRLRAAGVQTPAVMMYGVERAYGMFQRCDVITAEVVGGRDLSAYMAPGEPAERRTAAWSATVRLVDALGAAGARHHDLNVKNVLLAPDRNDLAAWVLDVDRVVFSDVNSDAVRTGNVARLLRSARKWRAERGAEFDESDMAALRDYFPR